MTIEEQVLAEARDIFELRKKHCGSKVHYASEALANELFDEYSSDLFNKENELGKYAEK